MPDVCCDLVWVRDKLILSGPQSRGLPNKSTGDPTQLLNLDPLVARAWLGVPLSQLTDYDVALEDVAPDVAGLLSEAFFDSRAAKLVRAMAAPPPELSPRRPPPPPVLRAGRPVQDAAARAELSVRQLERLFLDAYGLSPVRYRRILRFRRSVSALREGETLAGAAALVGFADQSHFSNEVLDLMGVSPSALLNHVAKLQDVVAKTRDY